MLTKSEAVCQHFEAGRAFAAECLAESQFQPRPAANDPEYFRQVSLQRRMRRQRRAIAATQGPASGWRVSLW